MKKKLLLALLFVSVFVATAWIVQHFALRSFNVLQVEGTFPEQSGLYFRNANGFHPILSETTIAAAMESSTENQVITLQLSNRLVSKFHVEIVHNGAPFELQRISLYSFFTSHPVEWREQNIATGFDQIQSASRRSTTFDLREKIRGDNFFFSWGIPLLIAGLITILVSTTNWRSFPAIKDTKEGAALRGKDNIAVLDGLRGLAALLVLFHHAGSTFRGGGALGVWLFFVLSGFLLTRGFVLYPKDSIRPSALLKFVRRRFNRIVPMYFSFIVVIYLFPGHLETAIRHLLFIQGDGHLWTIIHEMYFYLALPIIGVCIGILGRNRLWISIALLLFCALAWRFFGSVEILGIYALGIKARVYFEVFLVGMAGSCWYFGLYQNTSKETQNPILTGQFAGWSGMLLLAALMLFSLNLQNYTFHQLSREFPVLSAILALGLLLTAVTSSTDSMYHRILQHPLLRYVGVIGYSFYLLHPTVLFMLHRAVQHFLNVPPQNISEIWWIIFTTLITIVFASFTYSYIERPFLRKTNSETPAIPMTDQLKFK